jgi:acyl carrier protein
MSNLEKYKNAFCESFAIDEAALGDNLEYESIDEWDSVGHMGLIAEIEEAFDIELEMDDVIDFGSFNKGKEILKKYKVEV